MYPKRIRAACNNNFTIANKVIGTINFLMFHLWKISHKTAFLWHTHHNELFLSSCNVCIICTYSTATALRQTPSSYRHGIKPCVLLLIRLRRIGLLLFFPHFGYLLFGEDGSGNKERSAECAAGLKDDFRSLFSYDGFIGYSHNKDQSSSIPGVLRPIIIHFASKTLYSWWSIKVPFTHVLCLSLVYEK